jgi:transposase
LLAQARQLFALWHRIRDGTLTREGLAAAVVELRAAVQPWLAEGAAYETARGDKSARARTARTCRELLKVEPALGLFVRVEGIEPTNNAAEVRFVDPKPNQKQVWGMGPELRKGNDRWPENLILV